MGVNNIEMKRRGVEMAQRQGVNKKRYEEGGGGIKKIEIGV